MNKIYKVIWSKVKHQYVVTSEFAHSCTKSTTSRVGKTAVAALAAFVLTAGVGGVQAEIPEGDLSNAGTGSIAIGDGSRVTNESENAVAIGYNSAATKDNAVAIGASTYSRGDNAVAMGAGTVIDGNESVGIGYKVRANGDDAVALGNQAKAQADGSVAIGKVATVTENATGSTAIGEESYVDAKNSIAFGKNAQIKSKQGTTANNSIALGVNSFVDSNSAVAIGYNARVTNANGTAIGKDSAANGNGATALGNNSHATAQWSTALGYGAWATATNAVAIGHDSTNSRANTVSVGNDTLKRQIVNVAAGTKADDVVTVGQLQAASDEATKTIHGVTLDNGAIEAANGNFEVGEDGTTYIRAGQSQVQVRDDLTVLNHGTNSVIVSRDGVALTGDVTADNSVKVGLVGYDADNDFAPIYGTEMGADGSFSTAQGSFRVDKDGNVWAANGDVTIDADGTTYVHAGRSELQVTEDQSVLRHADNGIIVNEDGVAVAGDFEAGNGAVKINKDGEFWAGNDNFRVTGDGDVYSLNGKSQFQVTDKLVAMQYGTNNYVMVNEDGVAISGDLKLDGALDTEDLKADSLSVADGHFTVTEDGTMYSQLGKSQFQVRDDLVAMNYGPNTAVMLNEDGVTLKGDVVVEDNLMIGNGKTYFANDGSFTAASGKFSVGGYGEFTAAGGRFAVTADGQAYIGGTTDPNNAVVTKGDLTNAVEGVENSSVQWDDSQTKDSINGVGLKDGNITADTINVGDDALVVDEEGNTTVGGDLNVEGALKVNGDYVATAGQINDINANINGVKTDVSGIKAEIGVNEDGSYKDIENGASDVITGINKNTTAINEVKTTVGSGKLDNGAADLTSGINQNTAAIAQNSQAINSLGHRVSDLGDEIDSVGAISAALAGLHPLDYDGTGSKFQISAAMGTYDGTQAAAIGGFYHFNRDVMMSIGGATSFEGDKKTAANIGVTFRVGEGASGKSVSDDVMARLEAMDQKIAALEQENKELKNVLGAIDTSLSKEFPDVPANHWAYEAVTKLAGNDVVAGYPDGEFHGDRTMTRYEMAEIIYKAMSKGVQVDQKLVEEFKPEMEQVAANTEGAETAPAAAAETAQPAEENA